MSTSVTALRRVSRVNKPDRNAVLVCLVNDKELKLSERPIAALCSLFPPNRRPRDARQVLKGDATFRAFGGEYQCLADAMVNVFLKTRLPARQLLEPSSGRVGADLLQNGASVGVPLAQCFNVIALVAYPIAVGRQIDDPTINAQKPIHVVERRLGNLARREQILFALAVQQIAFTLLMFKQLTLRVTAHIGNRFASFCRPDRNGLFVGIPAQHFQVKRDSAVFFEYALVFAVQLVAVGNFGNTAHHGLRAQLRELGTGRVITCLVQVVLSKPLFLPGVFAQPITSSIAHFKRFLEQRMLFCSRLKFDLGGKFHAQQYISYCPSYQGLKGERASSVA